MYKCNGNPDCKGGTDELDDICGTTYRLVELGASCNQSGYYHIDTKEECQQAADELRNLGYLTGNAAVWVSLTLPCMVAMRIS